MEKIKSTLILCYGFVAVHAPKELVLSRIEADILKNIFQYFNTKVSPRDAPVLPGEGWGRRAALGALRPALEEVPYRSVCSLGHCPCLVLQVLGIKVETKVQCQALNLNSSLLFPAVSACLLLWAPLKSSPRLRSQQWCPAPGDLGTPPGAAAPHPGAPRAGPRCWGHRLEVPKRTAEGRRKCLSGRTGGVGENVSLQG